LSEYRAKAVRDFLIEKGCDKNRLKYKGYGSEQPVSTNTTEAGRQLNRRTEFKVLKVDLAAEQIAKVKKMKGINETPDKQIDNTNSSEEGQKKTTTSIIPASLQNFDADSNGVISYAEIVLAIDAFFEENGNKNVNKKGDDPIFTLLDFYFDQ
jgi:hypothetical protein